ncbi:deoxynucleoside triphosphate triphosphohydrolase SAMHD1-like isoform X2 [Ostrea edulis]|uniref:deoxynucleoside triphosphate triphosphohydrolase SAMHD1-like isoform X2 n=1 Tax=Ostrea edulis TaxID=37623 RepID=UPI0024AEC671|nr:deoxynucleoside triphosphate triphosphohydrolase SAMHD1-like isoform X2 [Ostrea edulis]
MSKKTIFNDSVWGPVELPEVCCMIINTPEFQRLRSIKQLGGCYFVYPGACHNRFEHSIGTSYLAGKLGSELRENQPDLGIDNKDILCLEVAGLCHDLGHGAFSHLFDLKFIRKARPTVQWEHEDASLDMVERIFRKINLSLVPEDERLGPKDVRFIKDLIKRPKDGYTERLDKRFLYEIVSNDVNKIDVDKWDYFARDCHMLGLHHNFQVERSIKLARVVEHGEKIHISFPKSEYLNIFDMFFTRYTLHRKAYQHPVTRAIEAMIADALWNADEYLLFPPNQTRQNGGLTLSESTDDMDAYIWVTDDVFHHIRTLSGDNAKIKKAQKILDRIFTRDLYKLIGEKKVEFVEKRMDEKDVKQWMEERLRRDLNQDERDMFEIQKLVLNYGDKDRNPMDAVKFYGRNKEPYIYKKEEMSLMMPSTFQQIYVQLFWKGSRDENTELKKRIRSTFWEIQKYPEEGEVVAEFVNTIEACKD